MYAPRCARWQLLPTLTPLLMAFVVSLGPSGSAFAQAPTAPASAQQSGWSALVDSAMQRRAGDTDAVALRSASDARGALADRPFAGPLEADAEARQDAIGSDTGYREIEAGLSVPLWRRGERAALRGQAVAGLALAEAQLAVARLELAREIRTAWWALAKASADVRVAREQMGLAQSLVTTSQRLEAAGEQARLDVLQAEAALAVMAQDLAQAIGQEAQARAQLIGLVGFVPTDLQAEVAGAVPIDDHPMVRAVLAEADHLARKARFARLQAAPAWRVGLDVRSERDGRGAENRTSTGVRISRPLGSDPSARVDATGLEANAIAARKQADAARITIETARADAAAGLSAARAMLSAQEARRLASAEALSLTERGWREGELSFLELLRARASAAEATRAATSARVAVDAAISTFNQAQGLLPQDQTP
jgi:outer membrane protein, heavy metal efflux system